MSSSNNAIVPIVPSISSSDIYSDVVHAAGARDADGGPVMEVADEVASGDSFEHPSSVQLPNTPPAYLSAVGGLASPIRPVAPLTAASFASSLAAGAPASPASVASSASAATDVNTKKSMKPVTVMAATTAVLLGIGGGLAAYFTSPLWIPVIVGLFAHPFGAFALGGAAVVAAVALIAVVTYVIIKRVNARKEADRIASNNRHAPLLAAQLQAV